MPEVAFSKTTSGIKTGRDAIIVNYSAGSLKERLFKSYNDLYNNSNEDSLKYFDSPDKVRTEGRLQFNEVNIIDYQYRPFVKNKLYHEKSHLQRTYQTPSCFPRDLQNLAICGPGPTNSKDFSVILSNIVPDLNINDSGSQCFPLYLYEKVEPTEGELDLTAASPDEEIIDGYRRKSAITDEILTIFHQTYGTDITKEDIFYYVYGILHSPEYRDRFSADLKKMIPRIPLTKEKKDYAAFTQAGRDLAHWHLNYETVDPHPKVEVESTIVQFDLDHFDPEVHDLKNHYVYYKVEKMKFGKATAEQKAAGIKHDKTTIIYNSYHTLRNIPLEAYDYIVNGKPALEWIIDRYQIKTDKKSGITNNPNDWCKEHNNPTYILDLLKTVTHVSTQTNVIVASLPKLNEITEDIINKS